jgi:hypothetical protein
MPLLSWKNWITLFISKLQHFCPFLNRHNIIYNGCMFNGENFCINLIKKIKSLSIKGTKISFYFSLWLSKIGCPVQFIYQFQLIFLDWVYIGIIKFKNCYSDFSVPCHRSQKRISPNIWIPIRLFHRFPETESALVKRGKHQSLWCHDK